MLQETYTKLLEKYTDNDEFINDFWMEISVNYSNEKRHYHTLSHLDNVLQQLIPIQDKIESWETSLFTLYYHDVIYNVARSDNEEQSAELAGKRMKQIHVPAQLIQNCRNQILATKTHIEALDPDTNYFTDADLSVLGQEMEVYQAYCKKIRQEYEIYPEAVYNEGRIRVLKHFLNLNRIYKTNFFYMRFEEQARRNISAEIKDLESGNH